MSTVRTVPRHAGSLCRGMEGALIAAPFAAPRRTPPLHGAEQRAAQTRYADQPRTDVRADHRPDLRDDLRVAAEDRSSALGDALRHVVRLDVLDEEEVGARVAVGLQELDHALERAARRAYALHRLYLVLHREDRLDLQRRADPRAGRADAPAAAQVLERLDGEVDLQLVADALRRGHGAVEVGTAAQRVGGGDRDQADWGAARERVDHLHPAVLDAALHERVAGLLGGSHSARDATRDVHGDDVPAVLEQRLVDLEEVTDRGLRRARQLRGGAQAVVEGVVVGDVALALRAAVPVDVERDLAQLVAGHDLRRQVMRGVGDDRDGGHGAAH